MTTATNTPETVESPDTLDLADRFLSPKAVHRMTSLSVTTRWRMERAGTFPQARQISPQRVAYLESEVLAWMRDRPLVKGEKPQAQAA